MFRCFFLFSFEKWIKAMPVHFIKQKRFLPGVRNNSERQRTPTRNLKKKKRSG